MQLQRTGFNRRNEAHELFRPIVVDALTQAGCTVKDRGVEHFFGDGMHRALVRCGRADLTAQFLRYLPDLAVVTPDAEAWLCELKTCREGYARYGNYSYELDSLRVHRQLGAMGYRVFVALDPGPVACRVDEIVIEREPNPMTARGSKTPLGVFSGTASYLRPLDEFIRTELLS